MSKRYFQILFMSSAFTVSAAAQAMLEHGIAAAGGSAAGVAGKQISNGIAAVMGNSTAQPDGDAVSAKMPPRIPGGEHPPGWKADRMPQASQPVEPSRTARTKSVASAATKMAAQAPFSQMSRPQGITAAYALSNWKPMDGSNPVASAETIAHVATGTAVDELGRRLGVPAARVVIPGNDGHLHQLVRYRDHAGIVGVIYITDGQVAEVAVK